MLGALFAMEGNGCVGAVAGWETLVSNKTSESAACDFIKDLVGHSLSTDLGNAEKRRRPRVTVE